MKRTLFALAVLLILSTSAAGQINQEIGDYSKIVDLKFARLSGHERPFVGTFSFEEPPQPLEPVTVHFTLTVCSDYSYYKGDTWKIRVQWGKKAVRLLSDSVFHWTGTHAVGDQFSGTLEVVPLLSGLSGFSVYWDEPGLIDGKLDVRWCFDHDGNLSFLGKMEVKDIRDCTADRCTFFNSDSVHIVQRDYPPSSFDLFSSDYTVLPPFRIGDTSTVRYRLKATEPLPNELFIEINTVGMELIGKPNRILPGIDKGEPVYYEVRVVPQPVRDTHKLVLRVRDLARGVGERHSYIVSCNSVYNSDKSLRFITDDDLWGLDSTLLPQNFRPLAEGDSEIIRIDPETGRVFREKY